MIDPVLVRLTGCLVFAGLIGGLLLAVVAPQTPPPSQRVAQADLQHRIERTMFTRP